MTQTEAIPGASHGIELRHLRYFVALADAGSFTQAAKQMVDIDWLETPLGAGFSLIRQRQADAGLGWLTARPDTLDAWTSVMQAVRPGFRFIEPPFLHSLPMSPAEPAALAR